MTWNLNQAEFDALTKLQDHRRYGYFVKKVADEEVLWSLKNEDGWVLASDGENQLVPVWPHVKFAEACATGHWAHTSPEPIALEEWLEKWLPGIANDGRLIAVFPTPTMQGFVVASDRLNNDIQDELSAY